MIGSPKPSVTRGVGVGGMASLSADDVLKYKKSAKAKWQNAMATALEFDSWGQSMEAIKEYTKYALPLP